MQVLAIFAALVIVQNIITGFLCTFIEAYSEHAGLLAFLAFFVGNFVVAWLLAVYITERFLLTQAQRDANEEHLRVVRGHAR
jgi:hypothetical protein